MPTPIKPNIGSKSDYALRPSVPTNQKESSTEFNLMLNAVRNNYERLMLDWITDIADNDVLPVGQYVLYVDGIVYKIITGYSVETPKTWVPANGQAIAAPPTPTKFKGVFANEAALEAAYPTAIPGDYALVDTGSIDAQLFIWDDTNSNWVASDTTVSIPVGSETTSGTFEEATDAETQAGTAVGATLSRLVVNPAKLSTWWIWAKTQALTLTGRLFAKHIGSGWGTLVDAVTISWNADTIGNFATVTLGGNRTLDMIANPLTGALYVLRVVQDGSGSRTLAFHANYIFGGTIIPILNSAAGDQTVITFFYDGTAMRYCGASGDYKLANLYLSAQAAISTDQRPIFIDSTGKLQKSNFVLHSQSAAKLSVYGNAATNTVVMEVVNSALSVIMKLYNDQIVECGGATSVISILSSVISGGAYLELNSNQAEAYKIIDKAAVPYITFESTTSLQNIIFHRKIVNEQGFSFEKVTVQAFLTTTVTAGAINLISNVPVGTNFAIDITVNHLFAYEQTNGAVVVADGGRKGVVRNVAGTVSGAFGTFTVLAPAATTATWSLVADNTNKRININFVNDTGTGKIYEIALDYSYIIRPLPTV